MTKSNNTTITTNFRSFEQAITRGEHESLCGWWAAAEECVALNLSASAYARAAATTAQDNEFETIRQYVGAVVRFVKGEIVQPNGKRFTTADFKGIDHLRKTAASVGKRKGGKVVTLADKVLADVKATKASKADIEAAIAALQALLK